MNLLWQLFGEPLSQPAIQKSLIGGSLVAVVCGVIGCFIILRRMAFLGDALAHAMLAGVTAGYLIMRLVFGQNAHAPGMLVGSLLAGIVTVALIGFVSKISRIKEDTAIGIMYTGMFAAGGVLASLFSHVIHIDLYHFVTGSVLGVSDADLWLMAFITTVVLAVVILFYRQFQIVAFDPVMAASIGVPVLLFDYLLTICTSFVVVGAVSLVGVVLVVGLLVTPAASAYLLCNRLHRMLGVAALFGVTSVWGGVFLSTWIGNIATGSSIVVVGTLQFMVVLVVAPRYGLIADWMRRYNRVPQQLLEDVLRAIQRAPGQAVPLVEVYRHVKASPERIRRALRAMDRTGLVELTANTAALTSHGDREAKRLVRAHRLWETYLQHMGTPAEQLHAKAHELEHVHDEAAVDYLDDMLGHPLTDPHGSEIPEDFEHLVPGQETKVSLLRERHRGEVLTVGEAARHLPLRVGQQVEAGARRHEGRLWTLHLTDGRILELDHAAADAVCVRLEKSG